MSSSRRVAIALAASACLATGALVAAFAAGVSLDLSRWRDAAAQQASVALGRPVTLHGALRLSLGRQLRLRIGDLRIANPPGFSDVPFATIGEATVRIDLFDALRGDLRMRRVEAGDVDLRLERSVDGRGNWSFSSAQAPSSPRANIDVGPIDLRRLVLHFHDQRSATRRSLDLDELSGSVGPSDPLRLTLRGRVDNLHPYLLRFEGATLQALQRAGEPWPFRLALESSAAKLHAQGSLDARQGEARFHFGGAVDDLAVAARVLGARWPQLGRASLSGDVVARVDEIAITELRGRVGEADFSGQLTWSLAADRPRFRGALSIASLDLRPFMETDPPVGNPPPDEAQAWPTLPLRELVPADLELEVSVGRWLGLSVGVQDAKLALHADARGVRAPFSATLAGAGVSGQFDLDLSAPTPTLALRLDARDLALDGLVRDLPELQGLEGTLGHAGLRLSGRGDTPGAVLRGLEASLGAAAAKVSYRHADAVRPIVVALDTLQLEAARGEPLRGSAQGSLLGQRTRLVIRGGTLHELLGEHAMPLDLELAQARATLRVQGVFGPAAPARDTALGFDLQARRAGDLAPWLPVAPQSDLRMALKGRLRMSADAWFLERTALDLGRSRLRIDARRTQSAGRPLTTARVQGTLIDVPQLTTLLARASEPPRAGARLDVPILAGALDLADTDLELDLQRVWLGRTELTDVAMVARTRQGRLLSSPASGKLAGAPFTALVELDATGEAPSAKLDLSTHDVDVGALLRALGLAEDIDARADSLQLALHARGNSLRELAGSTAMEARLVGGRVTVLGAAQRPAAEIALHEANISADAGQPVRLRLDGTLDGTSVRVQLSTGSFADFAGDATRVPFSMAAQAAGARMTLDGEVQLPLGSAARLSFEMSGERLDTLSALARVELPAWGPWSLRGPMIRMTSTGYELQGLTLAVGQSTLKGSGSLDVGGPRPRAELRVVAPSIQLDDFPMPQRLTDPLEPPRPDGGLRSTSARTAGRIDGLLSARFLRRFDANVEVHAGQVLAGADRLADGNLQLKLREGRLELDPVVLNLPGGGMALSMAYDLKESVVDFQLAARVERFDYGIIARRLDRANDLRGLFSLDLELAGRAPALDSIMRHANGALDIAVWPTELRSGVFNLWSANLVLALLPLIDPGQKSRVNCIVGRFDLKDGDLSDDKILIDTSTVRILGTGHANLRTEELGFIFRPRAKGPRLFRLQTPLRVSGTLSDQRFEFDPKDVFHSAVRMVASPILLPIERFTLGPLPTDGADVCTDPIRAASR